jgi:hypothetical protein
VITFFTTAKAFTGHTAVIQRNALRSWLETAPDAEILLFGDDAGAEEAARELNIRHIPAVKRVSGGPKALRPLFCEAQRLAKHDVLCYANCDIVLTPDLLHAINVVEMIRNEFLMVGRRWNLNQDELISMANQSWAQEITSRARAEGEQLSGDWIDYFVFRKGLYQDLPDLVIGRVFWDQWLVWKAKASGAVLVDATAAVTAIHQNHDYCYHAAGRRGVWSDDLARRNYTLAGGRWNLCTIDDATHLLGPYGLSINPTKRRRAMERFIHKTKESAWAATLDWSRPLRRAMTSLSKSN